MKIKIVHIPYLMKDEKHFIIKVTHSPIDALKFSVLITKISVKTYIKIAPKF